MQSVTCDVDLKLVWGRLASMNQCHDPVDNFLVEATSQPALHEPPMHQGAGATQPVTPHRGVGHPPGLQTPHNALKLTQSTHARHTLPLPRCQQNKEMELPCRAPLGGQRGARTAHICTLVGH